MHLKIDRTLYSYLHSVSDKIHLTLDYQQTSEYTSAEVIGEDIVNTISTIKNDSICNMQTLISIHCIDYPNKKKRFEIIYNLLNMENNFRLLLKYKVSEGQVVPSITDVFPNADWYEREIWDMYGVMFSGHKDMRRILTDYGFVGHPMRKDFPLTGYIEVHYDNDMGVVCKNVNLSQDARFFEFRSQWDNVLPGDEKVTMNTR